MVELNRRANVLVATFAFPVLAFAFVFAEDIVTIIYTAAYADAAQVMRVCIVGLAALVLELATTMQLLRQGAFVLRVGLIVLAFSIALSWCAAQLFGLAGAAAGSVAAIYVDLTVTLRRVAQRTGIPVRQQQDWRVLGLLMLSAVIAAVLAGNLSSWYLAGQAPWLRAVAGGLLVAAAYVPLAASSGPGRGWLAALRAAAHGP
jgi:O-antigen/teichoic acid export membrane protein